MENKSIVIILLLACCLSFTSALNVVRFAAVNASVDNQSGEWNFRFSSLNAFNAILFNGINFASLSANGGNGNAQADGVFGAAYNAFGIVPPSVYLSFFEVAAQFSFGNNGATANVDASKAFVANVYLNLQEIDAAGTVVKTTQLKDLIYTDGGNSLGNDGLRFAAITGNLNPGSITFTFVVSDVLGVLDVPGNPIITPKSMEVIVEINGYGYQANTNSLKLNIGTASGAANVNVDANVVTMVSGAGNDGAYVQLSNQAQVNGQIQPVSVSGFVQGDASAVVNGDIQAQVNAKYGAGATFQLVSVTFPAGAAQILYDPSLGVGNVPSSSYLVGPSAVLFLLALLVVLF